MKRVILILAVAFFLFDGKELFAQENCEECQWEQLFLNNCQMVEIRKYFDETGFWQIEIRNPNQYSLFITARTRNWKTIKTFLLAPGQNAVWSSGNCQEEWFISTQPISSDCCSSQYYRCYPCR